MFIERSPIQKSRKPKTLIYGVGNNDATYATSIYTPEGKKIHCPYFSVWKNMLRRCYSPECHQRQPTYKGCSVVKEWHTFSVFKTWMKSQDWKNKELDKDLLVYGNKVYGPKTCVFLTRELNALLVLRGNARGDFPLGVSKTSGNRNKQFIAQLRSGGKQKILGYFHTPEEAAETYKTAKLKHISNLAENEANLRIKEALLRLH